MSSRPVPDPTPGVPEDCASESAEWTGLAGRKRVSGQKGKALRLSDELVGVAESHAAVSHRSVPKQIEHWAQLGRVLESKLTTADTYGLLSGQLFLAECRLSSATVPSLDAVVSGLENARANGSLADAVSNADHRYSLAEDDTTIRRVDRSGVSELGDIVDGHFIARRT